MGFVEVPRGRCRTAAGTSLRRCGSMVLGQRRRDDVRDDAVLCADTERRVGGDEAVVGADSQRPALQADRGRRSRQVQDAEADSPGKHEAACRHVRGDVKTTGSNGAGAHHQCLSNSGVPRISFAWQAGINFKV